MSRSKVLPITTQHNVFPDCHPSTFRNFQTETSLPLASNFPNSKPIASTMNSLPKSNPCVRSLKVNFRLNRHDEHRCQAKSKTQNCKQVKSTSSVDQVPIPSSANKFPNTRFIRSSKQTSNYSLKSSNNVSSHRFTRSLSRSSLCNSIPTFHSTPFAVFLILTLLFQSSLTRGVASSTVSPSATRTTITASVKTSRVTSTTTTQELYSPLSPSQATAGITYSIAVFIPLTCGNERYSYGETVSAAFSDQARDAMERQLAWANSRVKRSSTRVRNSGRHLKRSVNSVQVERVETELDNLIPNLSGSTKISSQRVFNSSPRNGTFKKRKRSKGKGHSRIKRSSEDPPQTIVNFDYRMYDSCDEDELFSTLFPAQQDFTAIVGPGNTDLCETASRLNNQRNKATFSWTCTDRFDLLVY